MKVKKELKICIAIAVALIIMAITTAFVLGSNNLDYLLSVADDGSLNASRNDETLIERKITASNNSEITLTTRNKKQYC